MYEFRKQLKKSARNIKENMSQFNRALEGTEVQSMYGANGPLGRHALDIVMSRYPDFYLDGLQRDASPEVLENSKRLRELYRGIGEAGNSRTISDNLSNLAKINTDSGNVSEYYRSIFQTELKKPTKGGK